MEASEIRKIVKIAAEYGIKSIKVHSLEIEFFETKVSEATQYLAPITSSKTLEEPQFVMKTKDGKVEEIMPTEDEMLFWSTDAFDEIKQDRKTAGEA